MKKTTVIQPLLVAAICFLSASAPTLRGADATYDNLQVNGQADFLGNTTTFGSGTGGQPGFSIIYTGSSSIISFTTPLTSPTWQWLHASGTVNVSSMKLDGSNQLLLYSGTNPTPTVTINPSASGTSSFAGNVFIGGTNNLMPNQSVVSGSSILNVGMADSRYLTQTAGDVRYALSGTAVSFSTVAVGGGTVSPSYALNLNGKVGSGSSQGYMSLNDAGAGISIISGSNKAITMTANLVGSDGSFWVKSGTSYLGMMVDSGSNTSFSASTRQLFDSSGNLTIQYENSGGPSGLPFANAAYGPSNGLWGEGTYATWPMVFFGTADDNCIMLKNTSTSSEVILGFREGNGAFLQSSDASIEIEGSGGWVGLVIDAANSVYGGMGETTYFGSYGDGENGGDVAIFTRAEVRGSIQDERVRIKADTGNVGIAVTDPEYKLDVDGDGRFTGPVHLEPAGDLDMGEFTTDPHSGEMEMRGSGEHHSTFSRPVLTGTGAAAAE